MKYNLICNNSMESVVKEIFNSKEISLDDNADTVFIDRKENIPDDNKIYIVFNSKDLNTLINFIDGINNEQSDKDKRVITGKIDDRYEIIPYADIIYFEANNNVVECYTNKDKIFRVKEKLYELDKRLDKKMFFRISKSYIVNVLSIQEIIPWFGGRIRLKFQDIKTNLEVTRSYTKSFKEFLEL